jgi:hypothetical protein
MLQATSSFVEANWLAACGVRLEAFYFKINVEPSPKGLSKPKNRIILRSRFLGESQFRVKSLN